MKTKLCEDKCPLCLAFCVNGIMNICPFPVSLPDLIRKHFGYGQLWSLWPACSQNQARLCRPDPTSPIRFGSGFPKKAWTILCKTDPDLIWTAWFCPNASSPEASRCARTIRPSFWQNATSPLPVSDFQTRLCSSTNSLDRV